MPKTRTLIVDDSFFARKLLREILQSDRDIEIVGEAKDGAEAVIEAARLKPDVITMDFKMPKMDGAEATEVILSTVRPPPAILMVSAYTKEGANETLRSLRAGAVDFILKPSGEISFDLHAIQEEIIAKIKAAATATVRAARPVGTAKKRKARAGTRGAAKAVVIGASTGGPSVIEDILAGIRPGINAALLIAQHMPPFFTKTFAARLNGISPMRVREAEDGDAVRSGLVLVAPGDFHMRIEPKKGGKKSERVVRLTDEPAQNGLRPAIDKTMISVVGCFGESTIGVILSGMGTDGTLGAKAIKAAGGTVLVQDPSTAVIDSMPAAVIKAGLADEILPPENIAKRLAELCD